MRTSRTFLVVVALFFAMVAAFTFQSCEREPVYYGELLDTTGNGNPIDTTGNPIDTTGNPIDTTGNPIDTTTVGGHPCSPDSVYFERDVLPILQANCAFSGCHLTPTDENDEVGLANYNDIMNTGGVNPGSPNNSDLYEVITENDEDDRMPPEPYNALTAAQIQIIRQWIQQGALNLYCDEDAVPCNTDNVSYSATVLPIIQNNCMGCHSAANTGGGILLTNYAQIQTIALNGKLYGTISHSTGYSPMPKNLPKMSDCAIAQIQSWVNAGAPNN